MKYSFIEKKFLISLFFCLIFLGVYLCFIGGYGSDEDTLPMIYVFEAKLLDGRFVSSRFTGNPVAEIGIGFLAYYFGSFASNFVTFVFFLLGVLFFYLSLNQNINLNELLKFIILCLTSPILFFDNLESIDYSWALFLFSLGSFFYSKKIFELAVVFFAFSVGTRINFILFVFIFIFFFNKSFSSISYKRKIFVFFSSFIVGGLFYLPIWFDNSFNLSWLTAARPTDQGFFGLFARFIYKTYYALGVFTSLIIFFYFYRYFYKIIKVDNFKLIFFLLLSNLIIFLWIPAEYSYLQIFLVCIFYLIFKIKLLRFFYLVILCNFISWFFIISFLEINYKDNSYCGPKNALSVNFNVKFETGYLNKYLADRGKIKCWIHNNNERSLKILQGKSLK